jgi:hypothetical protein
MKETPDAPEKIAFFDHNRKDLSGTAIGSLVRPAERYRRMRQENESFLESSLGRKEIFARKAGPTDLIEKAGHLFREHGFDRLGIFGRTS